jgi:hypothetical protein
MSRTFESKQLLCTFATNLNYNKISEEILSIYPVYNNRIFIFLNEKNEKEAFLTFNILNSIDKSYKYINTILIHRKKETNTLYTLNAMNKLIEEENGVFDKTYVVRWDLYKNSLILTGDISIKIIPLKIHSVLSSK